MYTLKFPFEDRMVSIKGEKDDLLTIADCMIGACDFLPEEIEMIRPDNIPINFELAYEAWVFETTGEIEKGL